jgi:hypothetical protein
VEFDGIRAAGFFADSLVQQLDKLIAKAQPVTAEDERGLERVRHMRDLAEDLNAMLRDARREPIIIERQGKAP